MVKKTWKIVSTILVTIIVAVALSLVAAKLLGAGAYTVLSGSMEPAYKTGSLIYTKKVDPRDLKKGDPITFAISEDVTATHRIVEIKKDPDSDTALRFITKGDANEEPDAGYVDSRNVIGMPIFSIPFLGYLIDFLKHNTIGYFIVILLAVILLIYPIKSAFQASPDKEAHK